MGEEDFTLVVPKQSRSVSKAQMWVVSFFFFFVNLQLELEHSG